MEANEDFLDDILGVVGLVSQNLFGIAQQRRLKLLGGNAELVLRESSGAGTNLPVLASCCSIPDPVAMKFAV
ncbi:MAG: hypothetical protein ACI8W8_003495 [Rhodothermales bacterium]